MGAETSTLLTTGQSHVEYPKILYEGRKSGYFSADILQYGRFNVRGKGEPEKLIKFEDGVLYAPGPRGMPTPALTVQKELEKDFRDELFEIVEYLEKVNFEIKNVAAKTENPEEIAKAIMHRGNVFVTLSCRTRNEQLSWPSPSSFSYYSLFVDHPKRYVGNKVVLSFEIGRLGEISEEEKLLIEGINTELLKKYNFRN